MSLQGLKLSTISGNINCDGKQSTDYLKKQSNKSNNNCIRLQFHQLAPAGLYARIAALQCECTVHTFTSTHPHTFK